MTEMPSHKFYTIQSPSVNGHLGFIAAFQSKHSLPETCVYVKASSATRAASHPQLGLHIICK